MLAAAALRRSLSTGKPTIRVEGANLQVVSGPGATSGTVNGTGNLVVGYDEGTGSQTGSHNLPAGP